VRGQVLLIGSMLAAIVVTVLTTEGRGRDPRIFRSPLRSVRRSRWAGSHPVVSYRRRVN
jgi:hypothetical protein